ncbi:hypothetical protein, partial [Streptomyces achromogenes]|uniref:hypothetical protein n=1 Tax=Streptomyces achromogenes TaxID=67255 RepID=UPI001ADFEC4E
LYQIFSRSDFLGAFQVPALAFPFPAVPTLSEVLGRSDRPLISEYSEDAVPGAVHGSLGSNK